MKNNKSNKTFWDKPISIEHQRKPHLLIYVLSIIGLVSLIVVAILISYFSVKSMNNGADESEAYTQIFQEECNQNEINCTNVIRKINEYRIDNNKELLLEDKLLSEYAALKITNIPTDPNNLSDDLYDWYINKIEDNFVPFSRVYSAIIKESSDSCKVINQIENDKILKNYILNDECSTIGVGTSTSNTDVYLIIAIPISPEERKRLDEEQYIQAEISKLEQSKQLYLDTIGQVNETLDVCPESFYQSCYDRVKETTDHYYEKIDEINKQIQEWKRKK